MNPLSHFDLVHRKQTLMYFYCPEVVVIHLIQVIEVFESRVRDGLDVVERLKKIRSLLKRFYL